MNTPHSPPVSHLLITGAQRLEASGIAPDEARVEARILLSLALGASHEALRLRPERPLTDDEAARFDALIARRARREPLAYITGERAFYGLRLVVSPAVLIPRAETEFVVEATLGHLAGCAAPRVADVGTGSGCIAVAVAVNAPNARVWASDVSPDALAVAHTNVKQNGVEGQVTLAHGDLLGPLALFAPFEVIVSNPPYIAAGEVDTLEPEVRDWEPRVALGTHPDGLHFYRRLAGEAPPLLAPGGLLVVEVGHQQAEAVAALWRKAGLRNVAVTNDYAGVARVVSGRCP